MNFDRIELSPNIHLNYAYSDRFKTDGLSLYFLLPLGCDTISCDSLLPEVLRMGSESAPTLRKMTCRAQELYDTSITVAHYNLGSQKIILFSADMLSSAFLPKETDLLPQTAEFLNDLIFHPYFENGHFSEKYVALRKKALIDAVRAEINHKGTYALLRCRAAMCEGTVGAYLPYGNEEMVSSVTSEGLTARYKDVLKTAEIECFYEGRATKKEVIAALSFLSSCANVPMNAPNAFPPVPRKETVCRLEESVHAMQARLVIGMRYEPPKTKEELSSFLLMLELLAYSPIAKLFTRVREKLGLCYSCSAVNDSMRGMLFLTAGIDTDNHEKAERAMLAQVRAIGRKRFTEFEFSSAKKSLITSLTSLSDMPDSLELFLLRRRMMGFATTLEEEIARIEAVTEKDVAAAARKLWPDTVFLLRADRCEKEASNDEDE